mgnify:FL=1
MSIRVRPVNGTEAQRASGKALLAGECFYLSDHKRLLIHDPDEETGGPDYIIGPAVFLGTVSTAIIRKGLHANITNPWGCWPGDWCKQSDTNETWLCVANNGVADTDWEFMGFVPGRSPVTEITNANSPYTVQTRDHSIVCDCSAGAIVVNLPAVSGELGRNLRFKKKDASANSVTVDGSGAETIDGAATQVLAAQWNQLAIFPDSTQWLIV